ncbi:hypothetical protein F1188_19830 [Roseospira marina]|uniref:Uncharacterized protein n=1 Tax=Roseospira marina TaxID=140057 RepID=A0A5M6I4V6_9PROT|nr:hypothetical protein [Roseospira marina]KAA5603266.1 hypothetical protein F1188_19830 [Roseospira marina]MBB4316167.1 hypothetical protein [Roseospira marina]MBB5089357.1 hypothetical protein [Roseospira marina]
MRQSWDRKAAPHLCGVLALALLVAGPALLPATAAETGKTFQHGHSTAPFWQVGDPSPELSRLCRQGRFNQKKHVGLYIGYYGVDNRGRGYTGVAKRGYNLIDPTGQAEADMTYHFFNDGYSNCKVYVAADPPPEDGPPPQ